MDLDLHGSGLAMMILTLGILVVLYFDTIGTIGRNVSKTIGPLGRVLLVSTLMIAAFLVGARLHS